MQNIQKVPGNVCQHDVKLPQEISDNAPAAREDDSLYFPLFSKFFFLYKHVEQQPALSEETWHLAVS